MVLSIYQGGQPIIIIIIIGYLKPYCCMQIIQIRQEYLINTIINFK